MDRLTEIANKYKTDKGLSYAECHGFTEFYGPYFEKFIDKEDLNILEIGIYTGASLKMLNEYFNNKAQIYAIDIDKSRLNGFDSNIHTYYCNQGSKQDIEKFLNDIGNIKFDIIIDDGSHRFIDQMTSLYYFKNSLKEDGLYILEDLHTSLSWGNIEESPLYFLNFYSDIKVLDKEKLDEISNQINDIKIYLRNNPNGTIKKRSITSIIRFK